MYKPLPDGYEAMILKARVAYYESAMDNYEYRLAQRMTDEGWLAVEYGSWSGERLYRATEKALSRVGL